MRLIYVPLDERPCNSKFPLMIGATHPDVTMVSLPISLYGNKKEIPDVSKIWSALFEEVRDGDTLVLSMDMLLYGGLIPSRLHTLDKETIQTRLENLKHLKNSHKDIRILASNCIMRCPTYNSSEEEPDYYADYGRALHRSAFLENKRARIGIDEEELQELKSYYIPEEIKHEYESRREFNEEVNIEVLKLVEASYIDALVIPQDDAAPYGYTAHSQQRVIKAIKDYQLEDRVSIYPGADEVGCTLCALALNLDRKKTPKFHAFYASTLGPTLIPLYEDRPMNETLKHHVLAVGGALVATPQEADIILAINSPGLTMQRAKEQHHNQDLTYNTYRNLREFVMNIKRYIQEGYDVIVSDSAYGNGGDIELLKLLDNENLLDKIVAYSAWNTNANTLGTALCTGIYAHDSKKINTYNTLYRVIEDSLYQAIVRQEILESYLPEIGRVDYHFEDRRDAVIEETNARLLAYYKKLNVSKHYAIENLSISFPWNRVFEIDLVFDWRNVTCP